jgi:hypothetical protein
MTDNQSDSPISQPTSDIRFPPIKKAIHSPNLNIFKPSNTNLNYSTTSQSQSGNGRNLEITNNHLVYIGDRLKDLEKKVDQSLNKYNDLDMQNKKLCEYIEKANQVFDLLSKNIDDLQQKQLKSNKELNNSITAVHNYIKNQNINILSNTTKEANTVISSIIKESKNIISTIGEKSTNISLDINQIKTDIGKYNEQFINKQSVQEPFQKDIKTYNQQLSTYQKSQKDIFEQNEQLLIYQKSKEQLEQLEQFKLLLSEINNSVQDFRKNSDIFKKNELKPIDTLIEKRKSPFQNRRIVSPPSSAIPPSSSNSNSDFEDTEDEQPISEFVLQKKAKVEMKKRPVRKILCTKCGLEGHTVNNCSQSFSPKIINRRKRNSGNKEEQSNK